MRIYKTINKVPGGLMVVPLFIGMVINTFVPHLLKIGGFTEALSNVGYPTILGMYLFTVGTKMTVRTAPRMLKRGFGIMAAKVGIATLIAVSVGKFFGGDLFGFSTLALLVAMSDTNGGMFMALTSVMGDKEDAGTYVPQSIETGPFLTMLILVGAGLANIPWLTMVSVIAPIAAGAVLGNLDEDLRDFFGSHEPIIVPFMAFTLGQTINLSAVVTAGIPGVVLGVVVVIVTGTVCILADRLLGGSGIAGAAASSTAGNSAAVPKAVAIADPSYAAIAPIATVQVAASVIVTAVLTPILTSYVFKRVQRQRELHAGRPGLSPKISRTRTSSGSPGNRARRWIPAAGTPPRDRSPATSERTPRSSHATHPGSPACGRENPRAAVADGTIRPRRDAAPC
jgi:2-keto-3-deoxygluconate permease